MTIRESAFETMLRETTSFIYVKDRQGRYVAASDAFAALFGLKSGREIVGKTDYDLVADQEHAAHFAESDLKLMEKETEIYDLIEPNYMNPAGESWTTNSKYLLRDEQGNVAGIVVEGQVLDSRYGRRAAFEYDLRSVVELAHDAYGAVMCDITAGRIVEFHNRGQRKTQLHAGMTWAEFLQTAREHMHGRNEDLGRLFQMTDAAHVTALYRSSQRSLCAEYYWEEEGNSRWTRNDIRILTNPDNGHLLVAMILYDIGAQRAERDDLVRQANRDSLTGLLNHEETVKRIQTLLEREQHGCLMMFDVDNFKLVNDTYGHPIGDVILITIAKLIGGMFRSEDVVGRVGGDEFMVFASGIEDVNAAYMKAQRILHGISIMKFPETDCRITMSAGIAKSGVCSSFESLYSRADAMLYAAKRTGKGRVVAEQKAAEAEMPRA